jgi:hypothetical protein
VHISASAPWVGSSAAQTQHGLGSPLDYAALLMGRGTEPMQLARLAADHFHGALVVTATLDFVVFLLLILIVLTQADCVCLRRRGCDGNTTRNRLHEQSS